MCPQNAKYGYKRVVTTVKISFQPRYIFLLRRTGYGDYYVEHCVKFRFYNYFHFGYSSPVALRPHVGHGLPTLEVSR